MRSNWIIYQFIVALLVLNCNGTHEAVDSSERIEKLLEQHEIFKARREIQRLKDDLNAYDKLYCSAILESYFNRPFSSNEFIKKILNNYADQVSTDQHFSLLKLKLQNHVKLFEYENASLLIQDLIGNYGEMLDSLQIKDLENQHLIWNALRYAPQQMIDKKVKSEIDLVDGYRIPTTINQHSNSLNLGFDTGANLSVIISSLADSLNMQRHDIALKVKGIAGQDVIADIAIASSVAFGNVELQNVIFLVFPDSALFFPKANFQILGLLGYPVLAALDEIQLFDQKIIIPEESTPSVHKNLAMINLTPFIELRSNVDTLLFTFDTGANKTQLYKNYFEAHKHHIEQNYLKTQLKLGGIDGVTTNEAYLIEFPIEIAGHPLQLDSAIVLPNRSSSTDEANIHGNLGLDVIGNFDAMIINFKEMFVDFI